MQTTAAAASIVAMRVSSTKHPQRRVASTSIGRVSLSTIFVILLSLNFIIFVVNVWVFLPTPIDNSFLVPTRRTKPHLPDPAVEVLRQALHNSSRKEIPYDIVPKILHQSDSFHGVVHQLPSIPARRRMIPNTAPQNGEPYVPLDAVNDLEYFLKSRESEIEEHQPLYLYNPMLVPLDDEVLDSTILDDLSVGQNNAAYIGVYRVSNFANCHGPGKGLPKTYANYLGLALLDRELNVIKDPVSGQYLDVVIDINKHIWEAHWKPGSKKKKRTRPGQDMQDCQILPARPNQREKSAQLVLLCNQYAIPIKLLRQSSSTPSKRDENNEPFISFSNMYGNELQLIAQEKPNLIIFGGKNLHYFSTNNGSFLEVRPGGPHEVAAINFTKYPYVNRVSKKGFEDVQLFKASETEPNATFVTKAESMLYRNNTFLIDRDSGSACCVKINWKTHESDEGRELLLGFSHRKTRKGVPERLKYSYVSRVYAFEPNSPFNIIARSGYFCLGFATDNEKKESTNEQVQGAANKQKLHFGRQEFSECPKIHFISGIAEKLGDDETVIVSYGVNDCYPRMIEVSKEFLVSLLKPL